MNARGKVAAAFTALSLCAGAQAENLGPAVDLKPGRAVAISVTIADGVATLGPARASNPGSPPKDGEIVVTVIKKGLSPYAALTAAEKTARPVDFVATGLIGDIKIDEIKICGRLDAPIEARIASGSWRISLNRFAARADGQDCQP
jgi:hypothetical protein